MKYLATRVAWLIASLFLFAVAVTPAWADDLRGGLVKPSAKKPAKHLAPPSKRSDDKIVQSASFKDSIGAPPPPKLIARNGLAD